jgi:hypothetical protein
MARRTTKMLANGGIAAGLVAAVPDDPFQSFATDMIII